MPVEQIISPQSVDEFFGSRIADRGRTLMRSGHVGPVTRKADAGDTSIYSAKVKGSHGNRYRTRLFVDSDCIYSECSCPYAVDCKHGAALAFDLMQQQVAAGRHEPALISTDVGDNDDRDIPRDNYTVEQWLQQLTVRRNVIAPPGAGRWHFRLLLDTSVQPIGLRPVDCYLKAGFQGGRAGLSGRRQL